MKTLRLEGEPLVTKWEEFKTLIKSQFTLLGMYRVNGTNDTTLGKSKGRAYWSTPKSLER